jgi:putative addiction module component (TIGR02574 family)
LTTGDWHKALVWGRIREMAKPALDLTKLTAEEKLELIDELWTSISPDEFPLAPDQRDELNRRLDLLDEEGPVGITWEHVRAEMTSG